MGCIQESQEFRKAKISMVLLYLITEVDIARFVASLKPYFFIVVDFSKHTMASK